MKGCHFDSAKKQIIVTCGVALVPVRFCVFKVNNRNIRRPKISNLKNGYQNNIN